jgi:hypothetical protein
MMYLKNDAFIAVDKFSITLIGRIASELVTRPAPHFTER